MPTLTYNDLRENLRDFAHSQNLTYDPKLGVYKRESVGPLVGTVMTPDDLAKFAWIDMRGDQQSTYRTAMARMMDEDRDERRRTAAMMMCDIDDPYDLALAELRRFVRLMAHADTDARRLEYYVVGWKQLIWQVKRKMLGLETSWEIMMSLVSRAQGTGKTHCAKDFGYLLGEFFMADGDCSLLSDGFRTKELGRYYLVLLDEFDRANKTQMTTFKRIISSESVSAREMYRDNSLRVSRNASFIVTSNRSIAHDIRDTAMRRFVEMRCREQSANDDFITAMQSIDWARVWSAADARSDEAPAYSQRALIQEFQAELTTDTEFGEWATERLVITGNVNVRLSLTSAYADYREWARNQSLKVMPRSSFKREISERYDIVRPQNKEHIRCAQLSADPEN